MKPPISSRRARGLAVGTLFAFVLASCGPSGALLGPEPTNDAECRASAACHQKGQCAFNRSTKKCVVGSNEDCAASDLCGKQNRCKKVGDSCGAE